jgi:hypothetical protein
MTGMQASGALAAIAVALAFIGSMIVDTSFTGAAAKRGWIIVLVLSVALLIPLLSRLVVIALLT